MNAGKAVYGILSTNAEVTAIVGTKIFPEVAEQETALPLIVYQLQSVAPEDTHDGPSKLDEVRFEFLCYADTYNGAADLGDKVRGALDRVSGTYNAVNVESVQFNDVDIDVIDAPRRYGQSLTFTFRIKRDDVEIAQGTPVTGAMLGDLYNVDVAGVTDNQILSYDAATGNWVPADDAGGLVDSVNGLTGTVILNFDDLNDVDTGTPSDGQLIAYQQGEWVTIDQDEIHIPINSVTGLQTELNTIPTDLSDLSDVSIVGTPAGNQALIYNSATNAFTSQDSYTNRFQDDVETGKQGITGTERAYSVKGEGDGVFADPESDTPAAGKVIVRKIYHKTGFITDADVIGDYTLIHTFADDTAYADTVATFEGFEDGATYGVPPFTLLQTWAEEAAAPTFTGLLNESYGSGAAAAYGTRRLNGNYSGACMTIRRASDGTTQAIGFVGEEIDESAITTFCTGTSCTVQVWHDQSQTGGTGSGNDATQTDSNRQPTIYTGGALVKEGGRLALDFQSGGLNQSAFLNSGDALTFVFASSDLLGDTATPKYFFYTDTSNISGSVILRAESGSTTTSVNAGYSLTNYVNGTAAQWTDRGTAYDLFKSGQKLSFNYGSVSTTQAGPMLIGNRTETSTQSIKGKLQEMLFWTADKSSVRTDIEGNISAYYQSAKLLDEQFGSGAEAAYSTRKLRRAQTDCMVIRRASDSTTQTIGFDANGNIDEAAINTFCSGTSCTVYQWIDQSGNGNTATAAAQANEPTIYTGGALVKENGRVALDFNGSSDFYSATISDISQAFDIYSIYKHDAEVTSGTERLYITTNTVTKGRNASSNDFIYSGTVLSSSSGAVQETIRMQESHVYNGASSIYRRGGTEITSGNAGTSSTGTTIYIGSNSTGQANNCLEGNIQEFILFDNSKTTGDRTSVEDNQGDYFTQNTPLLDTYTGAAAAYSLRKLSSSYSGSAIRVRRSSDNTEQDINFNVFGELDTVSLLAFAGAGDAFVKTWYCQSGNSNDATQTTTASQPQIVSSGAVIVENGKPAIQGGKFSFSGVTMTSAGFQVLHVFKNSGQNVWIGNNASNRFSVQYTSNGSLAYQGTFTGIRAINGSYVTGQQTLVSIGDNGTKTVASIDGAVAADSTGYPAANLPEVLGRLYNKSFGADLSSDYLVQEIIIYNSDQFSNRTNIENNLNTFYSIY